MCQLHSGGGDDALVVLLAGLVCWSPSWCWLAWPFPLLAHWLLCCQQTLLWLPQSWSCSSVCCTKWVWVDIAYPYVIALSDIAPLSPTAQGDTVAMKASLPSQDGCLLARVIQLHPSSPASDNPIRVLLSITCLSILSECCVCMCEKQMVSVSEYVHAPGWSTPLVGLHGLWLRAYVCLHIHITIRWMHISLDLVFVSMEFW